MSKFKVANQCVREGQFDNAVQLYRELLAELTLPMYRNNLLSCLHELNATRSDALIEATPRHKEVCFVTSGIMGPTAGGGIATCFYNMIRACADGGNVGITIIYCAHPYYAKENFNHWQKYFADKFKAKLIPLETNQADYGNVEMKRSYAALKYLSEKDGLFDTIVFHDFMGLGFYPTLAKKFQLAFRHTRLIISAHGNNQLSCHYGQKSVTTWSEHATMYMEREAIKNADIVTTPSVFYARWMHKHFDYPDAICIPNIIYPPGSDLFASTEVRSDLTSRPVYFYGRMERLKGIDVLIQAIKLIKSESPEFPMNLIFAGNAVKIDGVSSQDYIEAALEGTQVSVQYMINTTPEDFFGHVRESEGIAVFPTLGETSSCVVVEAILHNVPFIASDIEGIKELVRPEHHHTALFRAGDANSLKEALMNAMRNPEVPALSFDMPENISRWHNFLQETPPPPTVNLSSSPLISVIVPTKNRSDLLKFTLNSIIDQSYKNIEIIVVDDNSVDSESNKKICDSMGVDYLLMPENTYKGGACNSAASRAKGSYICFFDDDDIAYSHMLETYVRAFDAMPEVDVLSCFAEYFEHANFVEDGVQSVDYTSLALGPSLETNILANFFGKGTFIIKSEKFHQINGYQRDNDSVPMVDYRFYVRAFLNGLNIRIVPFALYAYRKNSPRSLFYENKDNRKLLFLAKAGIESELLSSLGPSVGRALAITAWSLGQPKFQ